MRYPHTIAQSAEFLRLAISLMSKQNAALHPVSYALWYEVVSGLNAALQAEVAALTANGAKLDEVTTYTLYKKYVAEADAEATVRANAELRRLLAEVSDTAAQAGHRAEHYTASLEGLSLELTKPVANATTLHANVATVLRDTREIKISLDGLRQVLDQNRAEVEMLREELQRAREEALVDALTGLTNRKGFDQAIRDLIVASEMESAPLCLILVDIDHFKQVNDAHGHLFGGPGHPHGGPGAEAHRQGQRHGGPLWRRRVRRAAAGHHARRRQSRGGTDSPNGGAGADPARR